MWQAKKVVDPTCVDQGYIYYVCMYDRSHTQNGNLVNALDHDYGSWVENGDGTHTKTCANDNSHTVTEDCNFGEWETTTALKCTEKGEKQRVCADCGYIEKGEIKATGHDWGEWKITKVPTYDSLGEKQQI